MPCTLPAGPVLLTWPPPNGTIARPFFGIPGGTMVKEFRTFISRGSVIDLAVGVIIGGAFGKIVSSLVSDVIMPPIGLLLNGVDFSNLYVSLNGQSYATLAAAQTAGAPTINYGSFINNLIDFLIVALVI